MKCDFCSLPIQNKTGFKPNHISKKTEIALRHIKFSDQKIVNITLIGGEVYLASEAMFKEYYKLLLAISNLCKEQNKDLNITSYSSLYYSDVSKVKNFLEKCKNSNINLKFCISYDPIGRFHNKSMLNRFMENEKLLSKYITRFNMVITKRVFEIIESNNFNDKHFDYLYNKYEFNVKQYEEGTNEGVNKNNRVSNDQFKFVMLYLYNKYPNCIAINKCINTVNSIPTIDNRITNKVVILPNNSFYEVDYKTQIHKLNSKNCFSCKYFEFCRFELDDSTICQYYNIYKEIDELSSK